MNFGGEKMHRDRRGALVVHEEQKSWETRDLAPKMSRAWRDLVVIVKQARAMEATPILLTYVAPTRRNFVVPNKLLRDLADQKEVALADNDEALKPLYRKDDGSADKQAYGPYFQSDFHLTAEGYDKTTDNIIATLEQAGVLEQLK
jgi:hypothetical protein